MVAVQAFEAVLMSRFGAQLLDHQRAERAEEVVHRLLAVQAQDARAFRLAVRARSNGCTVASVDAALTVDRTLVVSWLCRGTLHLVGADDYWWLHRLTAPRHLTSNSRRLAQLGVDDAQVQAAIEVILAEVSARPERAPNSARRSTTPACPLPDRFSSTCSPPLHIAPISSEDPCVTANTASSTPNAG
jgi:hypothetical protein